MFCQFCGKELPASANACPACGKPVSAPSTGAPNTAGMPPPPPPPPRPTAGDTVDALVAETERAARDLAQATAKVSKMLFAKADEVTKDPKGSAKKAVRRAAVELDKARKEIERALDQVK
ncbi:MAG TPA: zinc ribbon domain-containing protein [Thermoplasmata archaeon]|nr:zinc ribbon domain-containing protein [Thermoplasmata archaeon]